MKTALFRSLSRIFLCCGWVALLAGLPASLSAQTGLDQWTWRNPLPQGNTLRAGAWNGTRHVVVGGGGSVATSEDGVNWTGRIVQPIVNLQAVAWGAGRFVTVGSIGAETAGDATILTSNDGLTWTPRRSPAQYLVEVIWDGTRFVAIENPPTGGWSVLTSLDGTIWTKTEKSSLGSVIRSVVYGGGQFVGVGDGGLIATSRDGSVWTQRVSPRWFGLQDVAWSGSLYMAVGNGGSVLTSANGVNWTDRSPGGSDTFRSVTWDGRQFVVASTSPQIVRSVDGVVWTEGRLAGETAAECVFRGGSVTVAVGDDGTIQTSSDGIDWSERRVGIIRDLTGIAWSGSEFVAVGESGAVLTSAEGATWIDRSSSTGERLNAVASGQGRSIAVGDAGRILMSEAGGDWTAQESGTQATLLAIAWGNGRFVAVGETFGRSEDVIVSSPDGRHWTKTSPGVSSGLLAVAWGGGQFVAIGYHGAILTSADGVNWTVRHSVEAAQDAFTSVAWTGSRFEVFGQESVLTSSDGLSWSLVPTSGDLLYQRPEAITVVSEQLVAVTSEGAVLSSADSLSWTRRRAGATLPLRAVASNGTRVVAVGARGSVLTADIAAVAPLAITSQPRSQAVSAGTDVTFAVAAAGSGSVRYQWQKNGVDVYGATSPTLSLQSVDARHAGVYRAKVISEATHVLSEAATLTVAVGPAWAADRSRWSQVSAISRLKDVAARGSRFVAVGQAGRILTSSTGSDWSYVRVGADNNLLAVEANGERFVAVGDEGIILTSTDGLEWTSCASGTADELSSVVWTGSQFVALGWNATVTSPDGVNWTARRTLIGRPRGVAVGGIGLIAFTDRGVMASADGVVWNPMGNGPAASAAVWSGRQFVAVGQTGSVSTSTDGQAWTTRPIPIPGELRGVAWSGTQFVAVGQLGAILTSADGSSWTVRTSGADTPLEGATWNGTQFVVVGEDVILSSPDGATWTRQTPGLGGGSGIAWGNQKFVAVSGSLDRSDITVSPDGITWTSVRGPEKGRPLNDVIWTGTQFLAVGSSGTVATSLNGHTWTSYQVDPDARLTRVAQGAGRFVAIGDKWQNDGMGIIVTSLGEGDGSVSAHGTTRELYDVAWSGTQFVVVGGAGTVLTSADGVNWSERSLAFADRLTGVAWGGGQFVAVGRGLADSTGAAESLIITSADGVNWTRRSGVSFFPQGVRWTGSEFVAFAWYGDSVITSRDGLSWSAEKLPMKSGMLAIASSDGAIVAVGGYKDILYARRSTGAPAFQNQPATVQSPTVGAALTLSVRASGTGTIVYQWRRNGSALQSASGETWTLPKMNVADGGVYDVIVTDSLGTASSAPAIVGVSIGEKVVGDGREIDPNVSHPNGNVFDQVLVTGAAEAITADWTLKQVTRTSFIDLDDDIVQVEFSGPGTLSLVLDGYSAPALPVNYNQPVNYAKGHAGIVITGADERTNVSVFTVGRATAFDRTGTFNILLPVSATNDPANNRSPLFDGHATTTYDGIADIAFIAITSTNGKFGGVRTANAHYFATKGLTGVYAPGVTFAGPLRIGDITAFDSAIPVIVAGSVADALITGGDLLQDNGHPVSVSGLSRLAFVDGSTSGGRLLPAQRNRAVLKRDGIDATDSIVVNPHE